MPKHGGIEPGSLGGNRSGTFGQKKTQEDLDNELLSRIKGMSAQEFRKAYPPGSQKQADLNAALARRNLRKKALL